MFNRAAPPPPDVTADPSSAPPRGFRMFRRAQPQVSAVLADVTPPTHKPGTPTDLYGADPARAKRRGQLPTPPRRERPPDLEATAAGVAIYGPRRAVPMPFQLVGPMARVPADTTGVKLAYTPLEARAARITGIRIRRSAASVGLTYEVQVARGGVSAVVPYAAGDADLEALGQLVLQPGDELRVVVLTAGAAGTELHIAIASEQLT